MGVRSIKDFSAARLLRNVILVVGSILEEVARVLRTTVIEGRVALSLKGALRTVSNALWPTVLKGLAVVRGLITQRV